MMDDDRRGALLRYQLEGGRELHAELALGGHDLEQLRVIFEIGAGAVAPGVALALARRNAEVVAHLAVHPLGDGFGCLDREAVYVKRFGVFAGGLQRLEALSGDRKSTRLNS